MEYKGFAAMLELSAAAYGDNLPVKKGREVRFIDSGKTGIQLYMECVGKTVYIAFRGTDSARDWATDFRFCKKKIPYDNTASKIRVHGGFIDMYKNPEVRDAIRYFLPKEAEKVRVTGHSYGAALAVLCAVDLQYNFPEKDFEVVLFGCPRVGNRAFAQSFNRRVFKTFRVENGNDIVTKVPFAWMGFRHVGIRVAVGPPRLPGAISFEAHRPQNYYRGLLRSQGL